MGHRRGRRSSKEDNRGRGREGPSQVERAVRGELNLSIKGHGRLWRSWDNGRIRGGYGGRGAASRRGNRGDRCKRGGRFRLAGREQRESHDAVHDQVRESARARNTSAPNKHECPRVGGHGEAYRSATDSHEGIEGEEDSFCN